MPPIKTIIRDVMDARNAHCDPNEQHTERKADVKCPIKAMLQVGKRARAVDSVDKEARRTAILDAAERLFSERHELTNVADVAAEAGLAKGTVYLYFATKEDIYLALHMRHCESFFTTLIARLEHSKPFNFHEMAALAREHMMTDRTYMPLCATCMGFGANAVSADIASGFQLNLTQWLAVSGAGLERHFPKLQAGEGVRLLNHSYAMMIGLFHLLGERGERGNPPQRPDLPSMGSYEEETMTALYRYWAQVTGEIAPPI
ncbi:MAG: TetR/AcrR family transcriptional regulator [Burkholderiales bacterium]|nr:MAG: TetR/AcrR family transcriptional regulator [Betaproteobacteria bacterium]TAG28845.1 MAG: TetR/AcrR family transcriptional regulator [Burkholderiales bacterium]